MNNTNTQRCRIRSLRMNTYTYFWIHLKNFVVIWKNIFLNTTHTLFFVGYDKEDEVAKDNITFTEQDLMQAVSLAEFSNSQVIK